MTARFAKLNKHGQPQFANLIVGIFSVYFTIFAPEAWVNYIYVIYGVAAGFVYLLVRKVSRPHITLSIWATVAVVSPIFWLCAPERFTDPLFNLLTGGMILGSCFMATDYVTSPMSIKGGVIFGVGIGFITMMIRYFGSYPEGMSFAILIMNAVVPLLNMWFHQKKYGRD